MKFNKKMLLASTLALSIFAATKVQAEDVNANQNWTPRSVEEVKADLANQGDTTTYTVKPGDTLSTIAEAMGIDVTVLAKVNAIADVNVIFPGTVITATYDANHSATGVTIQAADQTAPQASVDLSNNQVTVGDNTTSLDAIETPTSSEAPAADTSQAMPAPEAPASEQAQTSEVASQAPVSSETANQAQAETVNPDNQATDAAQPVAEQVQADQTAPQAQEPASEQAASSEMPVASSEDNLSEASVPVSESQAQAEAPADQQAPVAPEAEQPTATEQAAPQNASVDTTGLQPSAANFANDVANRYGTTDIGGVRPGDSGDHGTGNAVDVMTYDDTQLGQEVANYATSNMEANNISYVIYQQKFYAPTDNIYGPAYTWNDMPDRGDATANHMDHVHVSFNN